MPISSNPAETSRSDAEAEVAKKAAEDGEDAQIDGAIAEAM